MGHLGVNIHTDDCSDYIMLDRKREYLTIGSSWFCLMDFSYNVISETETLSTKSVGLI